MLIKGLILLFIIAIFYSVFRFLRLYNVGIELANNTKKYERINPDLKQTILVFGDSTAVGTGTTDNKFSTASRIGEKFPESEVLNFGINGAKLVDVIVKELVNAKDNAADIIIIQAGANDIVQFTKLKDVEKQLKQVIELVKSKLKSNKDVKIIVLHSGNVGSAPIFPFYISYLMTQRSRKVREIYIKVCAEEKVNYVDLFQEKNEDIFLTDPKKYFGADSFHPSNNGYKYWFEKISNFL